MGNWAQLQLNSSVTASRMECAQLCEATAACTAMNFQGLPNAQCKPPGEGAGQNTCLLFGGSPTVCQEEANSCWALGYMFASSATTGSGTSGTTVAATTTADATSTTA